MGFLFCCSTKPAKQVRPSASSSFDKAIAAKLAKAHVASTSSKYLLDAAFDDDAEDYHDDYKRRGIIIYAEHE
jgi:hypothetical protein